MKLKSILFMFLCAFNLMLPSLKASQANTCESVYKPILEDYLANMDQELYPCLTKELVIDGLPFYEIGECELVDVSSIRFLQQRTNSLLSTIESGDECSYKSILQEFTTRVDVLVEELMELERERITASGIVQGERINDEFINVLNQLMSILKEGKIRIEMIEGAERPLTPF